MPLVEVDLDQELFDRLHQRISVELQEAQVEVLEIPADDLFQVFRPHASSELVFSSTYGGVDRQSLMVIRMTMVHRHPVERKRRLFRRVTERLATLGVRAEDVQIVLVENGFEDWFAGTHV